MKKLHNLPNRKRLRIKQYDYSRDNYYFTTVCCCNNRKILGRIEDDFMVFNEIGSMVENVLRSVEEEFGNVFLHEYIVMPNHFHAIIEIRNGNSIQHRTCLFDVMAWIKGVSTRNYIRNVRMGKWPRFRKKFWHRSYYERIIRNEKSYRKLAEYILNNPINWKKDKYF